MLSFEVLKTHCGLASNSFSSLQGSNQDLIEVDGPFEDQPWPEFWTRKGKRKPYLVRNAFDPDDDLAADSWPTFDDILLELSTTDQARLIHHRPGNWSSFQLESGPLESDQVESFQESSSPWTILVNDVDRYVPELADWIDLYFSSWLPRWRRDDAQMSIAKTGGGIGPHVDNYDVFLIQTSGQRMWRIANDFLSPTNENELLVPDIPVSILNITKSNFNATSIDVLLNPGDCLYLPPRIVHWGTSTSDDCVTLSVGCRAPSAADFVARVSEHILTDGSLHPTAVQRVGASGGSERSRQDQTITEGTKQEMKAMVRRAIDAVLDDDDLWDSIIGGLTTEPLRDVSADDVLVPYSEENEAYRDRWGTTSRDAVELVQNSGAEAALIRNPGISLASTVLEFPTTEKDPLQIDRLWACGRVYEIFDCAEASRVFRMIESGNLIDGNAITATPESLRNLLCNLVDDGVLQACDLLLEPDGISSDED